MDPDFKHAWKSDQTRLKQLERRLYECCCLAKSQIPVQADRVADLVEQIDELRTELTRVAERQEKIADYVKKHVRKDNNGPTETGPGFGAD